MDFKEIIANAISKVTNINTDEIKGFIEIPRRKLTETIHFHVLDWQKN